MIWAVSIRFFLLPSLLSLPSVLFQHPITKQNILEVFLKIPDELYCISGEIKVS